MSTTEGRTDNEEGTVNERKPMILTAKQNPMFQRNESLSLKYVPMWWFGFFLVHIQYLPRNNQRTIKK